VNVVKFLPSMGQNSDFGLCSKCVKKKKSCYDIIVLW